MSTYHISVKAEPDWTIESHTSDLMLQDEDRNSTSPHASGRNIKKELQDNSSNVEMEEAATESSSSEPGIKGLPGEPLRVATPGFHRSWSTRARTSNFSKKDCLIFRQIIDKYGDVIFNKKTDNASNLKKKDAWENIVSEFNASTAEKRTFKQLQAKFDNMKRSQRRMSKKTRVIITVPLQEINSDISRSPTALIPATNEPLSLDGLANNEALSMNTKDIKLRGTNGEKSCSAIPLAPAKNEPLSLDDLANNEAFNMMEVQFAEGVESLETAEEPHSTAVTDPIPVEYSEMGMPRMRFTQKSVLIKHIRIHTGETPYACNICPKQFSRSFTLACHRRIHGEFKEEPAVRPPPPPPEKWTCDVCCKTFKNKSYKHAHMLIHTRTKEFQCEMCQKKFTSEDSLSRHVTVHRQVKCNVCNKEFKTLANLSRHMLVHTGERPFPCSYCCKRFTQKSVLMKHERIHTGEMPYECEICLKKFSRSFTLDNHLKRVHRKEKVEKIKNETTKKENFETKKKITKTKKEIPKTKMETSQSETLECDMKPFWCDNCDNWYNNKEFYSHECSQRNKLYLDDICEDNVPEIDYSDHEDNARSETPFIECKEEIRIDQIEENSICQQFKSEYDSDNLLTHTVNMEDKKLTINTDQAISIDSEKLKTVDSNEKNAKVRKKWTCKLCNETFKNRTQYQEHFKNHDAKGYCEICKKHFNSNGNLIRHMLLHSGEKPFACKYCNKRFTQKSVLVKHERIHTGEMPYKCDICQKKFARSFTLLSHKKVHSTIKPYSCQHCSKSYTQKSALTIHERNHTGERPFSCKICNKHFTSNSTLSNHNKIHNSVKPFLCDVCNRQFTSGSNFYSHMRIHTGDKKHSCEVCQKKFYTNSSLTKHKRVHTNKVCKVEVVPDDPTKQYGCTMCRRRFANIYLLERHARTHSGEKPYECEHCHKKFSLSGDLNRHRRTHTGEKRYSCATCNKQFTRSGTLKHHLKLHEGENPTPAKHATVD